MEKPTRAGDAPKMETLEEGKTYYWCSCGKSTNQPWCNGAHRGSAFNPLAFEAKASRPAAICTCKLTKTPPYCDGSHRQA